MHWRRGLDASILLHHRRRLLRLLDRLYRAMRIGCKGRSLCAVRSVRLDLPGAKPSRTGGRWAWERNVLRVSFFGDGWDARFEPPVSRSVARRDGRRLGHQGLGGHRHDREEFGRFVTGFRQGAYGHRFQGLPVTPPVIPVPIPGWDPARIEPESTEPVGRVFPGLGVGSTVILRQKHGVADRETERFLPLVDHRRNRLPPSTLQPLPITIDGVI